MSINPVYTTLKSIYKTAYRPYIKFCGLGCQRIPLPTEASGRSRRSGLEGNLYPWGDDQYGFEVNYGHTPGEAIEVGQFDPTCYNPS